MLVNILGVVINFLMICIIHSNPLEVPEVSEKLCWILKDIEKFTIWSLSSTGVHLVVETKYIYILKSPLVNAFLFLL